MTPGADGPDRAFVATVRGAKVTVRGDAGATLPPNLTRDLEGPWAVYLTGGRARTLRYRPQTRPFAVGILSSLASALQHPTGGAMGDTWESAEADGTGRYTARYEARADAGRYAKAKLRYEQAALPQAGSFGALSWAPKVVDSRGTLRIADGSLAEYTAHDELEVSMGQPTAVKASTDLGLTLANHQKNAPPVDWQSLWSSTAQVPMGQAIRSEDADLAFNRTRAIGVSFADALSALEKESTPATGKTANPMTLRAPDVETARAQLGAFGTMVSVLRAHPENIPLVVAAIRRGSPARKSLLDALGSEGSAASQAALVAQMRDAKAPANLRRGAGFALIRTHRPVEASVTALVGSLGDAVVRPYAVYGLGTYARRLREQGNAALSLRASDPLLAELAAPMGSSARVELLRGVANSGDARAFPAVRALLSDPDESIRAAAVDALRLMPEPEIDNLVAGVLANDKGLSVRIEALDAAALRGPTDPLTRAVSDVALDAPDSRSRSKSVKLLARWLGDRPELRTVLAKVAASDSNDEVRGYATSALADAK